jgi:hypothetical protein
MTSSASALASPERLDHAWGSSGSSGNARVGAKDAPYLEQKFQQRFVRTDVTQLGNYQVYLKLMIDGVPSKPFSAVTLPPEA